MAEKVPPIVVRVTGEDQATKVIKDVAGQVKDLKTKYGEVTIDAEADTRQAQKAVADLKETVEQLDKTDPKVKVLADTVDALADVKSVQELIDRLERASTEVQVTADTDQASKGLDEVQADVKEIDGTTAVVDVKIDEATVDRISRAKKETKDLGDGAIQSVGPLRDVAGAFDNIGGPALDAAEGALGFAESLSLVNPRFEEFFNKASRLAFIGGAAGLAVVALSKGFDVLSKKITGADEAFKNLQSVQTATEALSEFEKIVSDLENKRKGGGLVPFNFGDLFGSSGESRAKAFSQLLDQGLFTAAAKVNDELLRTGKISQDTYGNQLRLIEQSIQQEIARGDAQKESTALVEAYTKAKELGIATDGKNVEVIKEEVKAREAATKAAEKATAQQEVQAQAIVDTLTAQQEANDEYDRTREALDEVADAYDEAAGRATAWATAVERTSKLDNLERIADVNEAFIGLTESIKENGAELDVNTEKGRANLDAINDTAGAIDELIGAQLEQGASYDDVRGQAERYRTELQNQLRQAGLTEDQIGDYIETLGLTPEQVETKIKLSGQEEARLKLQALNIDLNNLPDNVAVSVRQSIILGDYVGALRVIEEYYRLNPADVRVRPYVNFSDIEAVRRQIAGARVPGVAVGFAQGGVARFAEGGVALVGERGPELVGLPDGANVQPSERVRDWLYQAVAAAVRANGPAINVDARAMSPERTGQRVAQELRKYRRLNGQIISGGSL